MVGNRRWRSLKQHNSLVIDSYKNEFYWNSRGENGDIINFIMALYNVDFKHAKSILNNTSNTFVPASKEYKEDTSNNFKFNENEFIEPTYVFDYLINKRKLNMSTVNIFYKEGLLKQDSHMNCCFIFKDYIKDEVVGIERKGIGDKRYINISQKNNLGFGFIPGNIDRIYSIYLFESAIDLMSFYEFMNVKEDSVLISMAGLKEICLYENLLKYKDIRNIYFCVDNDNAGKIFNKKVKNKYKNYNCIEIFPKNKDFNEDLIKMKL